MLVDSISATGVTSWELRVNLAQRLASHAITRKACLTAGSASHPAGTLGTLIETAEFMISPSRLDEDFCSSYEQKYGIFSTIEVYRQRLVSHHVFSLASLLVRPWP